MTHPGVNGNDPRHATAELGPIEIPDDWIDPRFNPK